MNRPQIFFVLAVLLLVTLTGCAPERPKNVLLVSLDTLRADHLGCYGHAAASTPHLDALAARGLRFERAATVMPLTLPAHSSLMTGTFPAYHGVRDNGGFYLGDDANTLAETLGAAGYRTGGFVAAFVLDGRWGIDQGFTTYFDDFDLTRFKDAPGMDSIQRRGADVVDRALAWLARDSEDERPFFAWIHLYDPHTPYEAPEPYRSRFPATLEGAYDAEIAYTDAQVGRLFDALEASAHLDDTVVVVVGDHGEMLGEHREITHGFFIYESALRIPLLIAGPGFPAAVVEDQVRIIDVMPTVLARLGIDAPGEVQGVDLQPMAQGERTRLLALGESWFPRYHYGWSELQSLQDGRYKFIAAPRRELYDLANDPDELDNLAASDARLTDDMEATLDRLLAEVSRADAAQGPEAIDPEVAERLAALGYVGASAARLDPDDDRPRGDPKDKIELYNLLKEAGSLSSLGELDAALERLERALDQDPEIVEAYLLLGNVHRKAERLDDAVAAYRAALELDDEHQEALYSLALAYKDLDRLDDALAGFERGRMLDEKNGKVIWQLADTYMRLGRHADAEAALLDALDLDLDRPRFLMKLGECYLEMGRPDDAEPRLVAALDENPELSAAHFHLGLSFEDRGRVPEAIAAYREAIASNDEAYRATFNLAKLLQKSDRLEEAIGLFRRTLELRPKFGTGHLYLGKALLDAGNLRGAEQAAKTGLENAPDPEIAPLGHFILADVYNRQGRFAEAEREAANGRRLRERR